MVKKVVTPVDKAWLRMEDPTNLMMITGVMIFGAPMDLDRLKATIQQRLLRFDRFRQLVVPSRLMPDRYYWKDDPHFNIDDHIQRITLPAPGDRRTLEEVASELMSTQLDFSKPLWEIHVVEHYENGCALIVRLHHSIADGIALVRVLLSMTDADADAPWPEATPKRVPRRDGSLLAAACRPARSAMHTTTQLTGNIVREGGQTLRHPSRAVGGARFGARAAMALGRLLLLWPDPKTPFKGDLGVAKRAAWSDPIPLQDVKAAGRAMNCTVNDVLLAVMTGSLRRYLQNRGESVEGLNIRAVVPVNLRPFGQELQLGNRFGLVFVSLPVGIEDPVERLRELKRHIDGLKDTPEAVVAFGILTGIGIAPAQIQDLVVNIFGMKATTVMTNVPGPKETIYLAGAPLETIMFWVPQSGRLGLGVSIISYAGQVCVGIATDRDLVPDPQEIVTAFQTEFAALEVLSQRFEEPEPAVPAVAPLTSESIAEMVVILEDAIQKVNALIDQTHQTPKATAEQVAKGPTAKLIQDPGRCQALTKAGKQCKNRALEDSSFCRIHQQATETG